jgi:hypothetical protein
MNQTYITKVTAANKMAWPATHTIGSRFLVGQWLVIDSATGKVIDMASRKSDLVARGY